MYEMSRQLLLDAQLQNNGLQASRQVLEALKTILEDDMLASLMPWDLTPDQFVTIGTEISVVQAVDLRISDLPELSPAVFLQAWEWYSRFAQAQRDLGDSDSALTQQQLRAALNDPDIFHDEVPNNGPLVNVTDAEGVDNGEVDRDGNGGVEG